MKKLGKHRCMRDQLLLSAAILSWWRQPVASVVALNTEQPISGNEHGIVPLHCDGHQNGKQSGCIVWLLFCWLSPWRPLGQYGLSSCPMPVSSGFWSSPGHATSCNAVCIAPVHRRGHWNGWRTRCICSSSSILSSTITVAKDHVMVH